MKERAIGENDVSSRKGETLCDQVVRLAGFCAVRRNLSAEDVEDCAMGFFTRKFRSTDLSGPAVTGEAQDKLQREAASFTRSYARQQWTRCRREVPLTGADGTEATGPLGRLVSKEPGPEERFLILELKEWIARALPSLTQTQLELFLRHFLEEVHLTDLQEETGRSEEALWKASTRLRTRLRGLLEVGGFNGDDLDRCLNRLDQLRGQR